MILKKRKIKYAAIFFLCWFVLLVFLVDGVLKFQTLVDFWVIHFGGDSLITIGHSTHMDSLQIHRRTINRNLQ